MRTDARAQEHHLPVAGTGRRGVHQHRSRASQPARFHRRLSGTHQEDVGVRRRTWPAQEVGVVDRPALEGSWFKIQDGEATHQGVGGPHDRRRTTARIDVDVLSALSPPIVSGIALAIVVSSSRTTAIVSGPSCRATSSRNSRSGDTTRNDPVHHTADHRRSAECRMEQVAGVRSAAECTGGIQTRQPWSYPLGSWL